MVDESPAFKKIAEREAVQKLPAMGVIKTAPLATLTAAVLAFLSIGGFFLVTTFAISYGTGTVGLSSSTMLTATMTAAVLQIVTVVLCGQLADRVNPIKIALWGCVITALLAFPSIWALSSGSDLLAILAVIVIVQPTDSQAEPIALLLVIAAISLGPTFLGPWAWTEAHCLPPRIISGWTEPMV